MQWDAAVEWVNDYQGRHGHLPTIERDDVPFDDEALAYCIDEGTIRAELPPEPRVDPISRFLALNALWRLLRCPYNPDLTSDHNTDRQIDAETVAAQELERLPIETLDTVDEFRWEAEAAIALNNWTRLEAVTNRWASVTGDRVEPSRILSRGVFATCIQPSFLIPDLGAPFERDLLLPASGFLAASPESTSILDVTLPLLASVRASALGESERVRLSVGKAASDRLLTLAPDAVGAADLAVAAWFSETSGTQSSSAADLVRGAELFVRLAAAPSMNAVVLPRVLRAAARCFEGADRVAEAIATLRRLVETVPSDVDAWKALARLSVRQGDTTTAFECFEKALEHGPEAFTDEFMVPLVLSFAAEAHRAGDWVGRLNAHPVGGRLNELTRAVLAWEWPEFLALSKDVQDQWVAGLVVARDEGFRQDLGAAADSIAMRALTLAVEVELRERVFKPLAEHLRDDIEMKLEIDSAVGKGTLPGYIARSMRRGKVTLGAMLRLWDDNQGSRPALPAVARWFSAHHPRLTKALRDGQPMRASLGYVNEVRDDVSHEPTADDVRRLHLETRRCLSGIVQYSG